MQDDQDGVFEVEAKNGCPVKRILIKNILLALILCGCDLSFNLGGFDWMGADNEVIGNNSGTTTNVSITYPVNGQIVSDSVLVTVTYVADFELLKGMIYIDWPDGDSFEATIDSEGHMSYVWDTKTVQNGQHNLTAEITHYSGGTEYRSLTVSVVVQN